MYINGKAEIEQRLIEQLINKHKKMSESSNGSDTLSFIKLTKFIFNVIQKIGYVFLIEDETEAENPPNESG